MEDTSLVELVDAITQLSGPAVVALFLLLIFRGYIVTKSEMDTVVEAKDREVKARLEAKDEVIDELNRQLVKSDGDKTWWRNIATDALEIGEAIVRSEPDPSPRDG